MLDYKLIVTVRQDNLDDFYAQGECAVARLAIKPKTKKILVHIKLTKHRLRKLFLFLRHRESECLWLLNSLKRGQKFVYKRLNQGRKKGKFIIIKSPTSTGKIIFK